MRRKEFMLNVVKAMPLVMVSPSVLFADPVQKNIDHTAMLVVGTASALPNLPYEVSPEYLNDWQVLYPKGTEFHLQPKDGNLLKTSKMIFTGQYDFDIERNRVHLESASGEKTIFNLGKDQEDGDTSVFVYNKHHFGKEEAKRFFAFNGRALLILD